MNENINRRTFLELGTLGAAGLLVSKTPFSALPLSGKKTLRFGLIADVHHGMLPDTESRLERFIEASTAYEADFIIQLGDFCHLEERSKPFMRVWNQFKKPKYHVLGNHDMDLNSKEGIMELWEMPAKYYSFVEKGVRFLVLDANYLYQNGRYTDYNKANFYVDSNYRTYVHPEQIEWLAGELEASKEPVVVLSHQSLWHYQSGVRNRLAIQKVLEQHAEKIICCFNGHNHIDFHHYQNGIHYLEINSASYHWLGDKHKTARYPRELLKDYKWLDHFAPYEDPLFAMVEIDPKKALQLTGSKSQWMPPSPEDAGVPKQIYGNEISPVISDYKIKRKK